MSHDFDDAIQHLPRYELPEETKQRHLKLFAMVAVSRQRRRRRRRLVIVGAGVAIALGAGGVGTAAALGVFSAPPSDRTEAHCYATAELDDPGNHAEIIVADSVSSSSDLGDAATSAMDICRDQWKLGMLNPTDPKIRPPQPDAPPHPIPELIACVLPSGQVGVFPGDSSTCAVLNLPIAVP